MQLKDVTGLLPQGLELLGAALTATGVGAPVGGAVAGLGALLGHALGTDPTPDAIAKAVQSDPQAATKLAELQTNAKVQLQQIVAQGEANRLASDTARIQSINQTMQVEDQTRQGDWRQWWGYISAVVFAFCVVGIFAYAGAAFITSHTEQLANIPLLVTALTGLFAIPLSVLGVAAWHAGQAERETAKAAIQ